jgi:spermidine synthase
LRGDGLLEMGLGDGETVRQFAEWLRTVLAEVSAEVSR